MSAESIQILIVDDEPAHAEAIRRSLRNTRAEFDVLIVGSLGEYRNRVAASPPNLAILDLFLHDGSAESILTFPPEDGLFPVIIMSSHGDEHMAVTTIQGGALDYIVKSAEAFADMPHIVDRTFRAWHNLKERQAAQSALRKSEETLRLAAEAAQIGFWDHDLQNERLVWSATMERLMGFEPGGFPGTFAAFLELLHPDSREILADARHRAFEGDGLYQAELHFCLRDGRERWELARGRVSRDASGRPVRMMGVNVDITDQKKAEETALKARSEFEKFFALVPDMVCIATHDGFFKMVNDAWTKILGYSREELLSKPIMELIHPDDRKPTASEIERQLAGGVSSQFSNRYQCKDGTYRWLEWDSSPAQDGLLFAAARDITERKRADEILKENEQRFRDIMFTTADWVWEVDAEARYTYASEHVKTLLGYEPREILGKTPFDFMPFDVAERVRLMFGAIAAKKESFSDLENANLHRDGTIRHLLSSGVPMLDKGGQLLGYRGADKDITDKKALEEQFRQAQKLESVGQLAGGIAHDFNNILSVMMIHVSLLQKEPGLGRKTQDSLNELLESVKKAGNLTRQLLMYSRRSVMAVELLDLNELVSNFLKMLGRLIGEHITIRFDRREISTVVEGDPGMIEQVLMNLAVNARDAMPKGGNLTISLESVQIFEECIKQNMTVHPGRFICLKVSDTGCGMDEATLQHVFEPFFTTKEVGKGTGLGLATAYGIVAQHKGWIEVESQAGNGAAFKVFFPAAGSKVIEQPEAPANDLRRGHETILYVEDDASLRRVVAQGLRLLGYRVLEADNGLTALGLWRENADSIDLLFSDMVMPKNLNGLELADKLRERKPTLPVIVSSGYNTEMAGQSATSRDDIVFFQKPYDFEALAKSIRHCLDQAASLSNASSPPDGR